MTNRTNVQWILILLAIACLAGPALAQQKSGASAAPAPGVNPDKVGAAQPVPAPSPEYVRQQEKLQTLAELHREAQQRRERAINEVVDAQIAISSLASQLNALYRELQRATPAGYRYNAETKAFERIEEKRPK